MFRNGMETLLGRCFLAGRSTTMAKAGQDEIVDGKGKSGNVNGDEDIMGARSSIFTFIFRKQTWAALLLLSMLAGAGIVAKNVVCSPQYSLSRLGKALERHDVATIFRYVPLDEILRGATENLAAVLSDAQLAKELDGFGGFDAETLAKTAAFGPEIHAATLDSIRPAIAGYLETGALVLSGGFPKDIADIVGDVHIAVPPTVISDAKKVEVELGLAVLGEPVSVRLNLRNCGMFWQLAGIDNPDKTVRNLLNAYVRGWRNRFASERAAHPDAVIPLPGLAPEVTPLTMSYIPNGKFQMGTPAEQMIYGTDELQHKVILTKPYWIGKYEVTNSQFVAFTAATGYVTDAEKEGNGIILNMTTLEWENAAGITYKNPGQFPMEPDTPVTLVSWNDAQAFCQWLSGITGRHFRLPTEAEWEYACRAGTSTIRFTGDSKESLEGYVNSMDAAFKASDDRWECFNWNDGYVFVAPVRRAVKPNPWGLYDMLGNVFEWCYDGYDDYPSGEVVDPVGPETSIRVRRGGGWYGGPWRCRSANRNWNNPTERYTHMGFRVAADADKPL